MVSSCLDGKGPTEGAVGVLVPLPRLPVSEGRRHGVGFLVIKKKIIPAFE